MRFMPAGYCCVKVGCEVKGSASCYLNILRRGTMIMLEEKRESIRPEGMVMFKLRDGHHVKAYSASESGGTATESKVKLASTYE